MRKPLPTCVAIFTLAVFSSLFCTFSNSRVNIVSFSLYGDSERYVSGALANAILIRWAYPGWVMRVYYDNSLAPGTIRELDEKGVQLIDMTQSGMNPMNWRFLSASDASVDVSCFRDVDSRLTLREYAAVSVWLKRPEGAHMIRDHPGHRNHPLMGGMWCVKRGVLRDMNELIEGYPKVSHFNADQEFLRDVIWPRVSSSILQHVAFGCDIWPKTLPMPTPRVGSEYVGAVYINGMLQYADSLTPDECKAV